MADIGIMLEGQEDLTWARFFRFASAAEELGFESLFRSDHLVSLAGHPQRETLAVWPSLTALALVTKRIRFGALVSPMTFRHPAVMAKDAAAISVLSGGRLDLGLGTGWNEPEHRMFGVPYPDFKTRLEMLDESVQVIRALWSDRPATFQLKHFQLNQAQANPRPVPPPPLILGGKSKRTLALVAKYADEWNCGDVGIDVFRAKSADLDAACEAIGRDPASIRRSVMIPFVIGKDNATLRKSVAARHAMFQFMPDSFAAWRAKGLFGGSPAQIVDQMQAFVRAGVSRFMMAHYDQDDLESIHEFARDVLPQFTDH